MEENRKSNFFYCLMQIKKLSAGLLLLSLGACSEKEKVHTQRETWLTNGAWRMTNYIYQTRAAAGGPSIELEYITGLECEADDLYRFAATKRLQWDTHATFCPGLTSQPVVADWGGWQLLSGDTKLAIDHQGNIQFPYTAPVTGPLRIVELTAARLVLQTPEMQTQDSVMTYTYRFVKE